MGQSPQAFKYQAVVRNPLGYPISNRSIGFEIMLMNGLNGPVVYSESHALNTDIFGQVQMEIGRGTPLNNSPLFSSIDWISNSVYMGLRFDSTGTGTWVSMGVFELLSVPYALNGQKNGSVRNQLQYWNDTTWVNLNPGSIGQVLTLCSEGLTWTIQGQCPARITSIACNNQTHTGTLTDGSAANGVNTQISYIDGNGGFYASQTIVSTGVTGLTAQLSSGQLVNGNGTLTLSITGVPSGIGFANFSFNIGGDSCVITRPVNGNLGSWRAGMIHCASPTAVIDVLNPITGKTWMDRNLGASQVATNVNDTLAFGDLYQWGRFGDGHQCRNSVLTTVLSTSDTPGHGDYITPAPTYGTDWRSTPNDNLWQGESGVNNPCPVGYRLPTISELEEERLSWMTDDGPGAFASPLKLTYAGHRDWSLGDVTYNTEGYYISSTLFNHHSFILPNFLDISHNVALINGHVRSAGYSVRCIRN